MTCEILCVGTELLLGQIVNTNAQYLAAGLSAAGVNVHHQTTVGDNEERLQEALNTALARADIVITTGGLGPTADDITKEVSAKALGLPMMHHPEAERALRAWFRDVGRDMTDNNLRQADFPAGAKILPNPFGTAPGCIAEKDGKAIINLPGPPREMEPMFDTHVMAYLSARSGAFLVSRYLRIFGLGESTVESRLADLMAAGENPTIAPYCSLGEVQLRLTVRVTEKAMAAPLLDPMEKEIRRRLGDAIYAVTEEPDASMEQAVMAALLGAGKTIATAESCTGGMIATRLTNVPGSSAAFREGFVTYADEAKIKRLQVRPETLATHGAVSREVAYEMALGLFKGTGADLCLSVTGIAGPDGGSEKKPVGLVYLGLAINGAISTRELRLTGDRDRIRTLSALHGMHWVLQSLS